jgi:hypothetical protein
VDEVLAGRGGQEGKGREDMEQCAHGVRG